MNLYENEWLKSNKTSNRGEEREVSNNLKVEEEIKALKTRYNRVLRIEKKAEELLDNATELQYEKRYPVFLRITFQLSGMINRYNEISGVTMTLEEILEGFQ